MKLDIRTKFTVAMAVSLALSVALLAVALLALRDLRVGGPASLGPRLVASLAADVQPPPLLVVELGLEMDVASTSNDATERREAVMRIRSHLAAFDSAKALWDSTLRQQPSVSSLQVRLGALCEPVTGMGERIRSEFIPMIEDGRDAEARRFLDSVYHPAYQRHREAAQTLIADIGSLQQDLVAGVMKRSDRTAAWIGAGVLALAAQGVFLVILGRRELLRSLVQQRVVANAPVNILLADRDLHITFANERSIETLRSLEYVMPCKAHEIVGQNIDIFHKNPGRIRKMLQDPANLPHTATIQVGNDWMRQTVVATRDESGHYLGPMLFWEIVTREVAARERAQTLHQEVDARVASLRALAEQLGDQAEGLSASTDRANRLTGESASSFQEVNGAFQQVASAAEEMSASVAEIARNVSEASRVALEAGEIARGLDVRIRDLDKSSREIGRVTEVVTDIADQTSLLALNATIESARAGEVGKGFAVVAGEVKELAKQTSSATEEIRRMVEGIQNEVGASVGAIEKVAGVVERIRALQDGISAAVEEQSATSREIASSISRAANESESISQVLAQLRLAMEEGAESARSSRTAAATLDEAARGLEKGMSAFRQG